MSGLFENPRRESYETETPEPVFAGERLVLDPATGRYVLACEGCDGPLSNGICLPCTYSPAQIAAISELRTGRPATHSAGRPEGAKSATHIFTPSTNRRARAGRVARG